MPEAVAPDQLKTTSTAQSTTPSTVSTPPTRSTVDPERTVEQPFPGSKDL